MGDALGVLLMFGLMIGAYFLGYSDGAKVRP